MMRARKAQTQMWWIIIAGLILLVVAALLLVILSNGTEKTNEGLFECSSKGGACIDKDTPCENSDGSSGTKSSFLKCEDGQVCCIKT